MRQRAGIMLYGALRYPKVSYFGHAYLVVGGKTKVCVVISLVPIHTLFLLFQYVARLGGSQLTHRPYLAGGSGAERDQDADRHKTIRIRLNGEPVPRNLFWPWGHPQHLVRKNKLPG